MCMSGLGMLKAAIVLALIAGPAAVFGEDLTEEETLRELDEVMLIVEFIYGIAARVGLLRPGPSGMGSRS